MQTDSSIQSIARQYESSWRDQEVSSITEFLARSEEFNNLQPEKQNSLLTLLLKTHIDLERRSGRTPDPQALAIEFPQFDEAFFIDLIQLPEPPPARREASLPSKYKKLSTAGRGGVGIVYRVLDQEMKRKLAIKVIRPGRHGDWLANLRLQQEAVLTGRLQHPGITPVYERGTLSDGSNFFSMKLVEGQTLQEILNRHSFSVQELLPIFEQVAQTVAYAHAQGVIHRDLKPQNVMVGAFGEVQVMDWGMA